MCYSAQVWSSYKKYVRHWGADVNVRDFVYLYWDRSRGSPYKFPKAMDASFSEPASDDEREIHQLIQAYNVDQASKLEQEIFKQRKRLADAERTLQTKTTKKALEDQRIASNKVDWAMGKLADLRRTELLDRDSRIFPGWYAPVMIWEEGRLVVKPMRYQCRPAGKPAFYDTKFPGTYNARRDNLEGFWKEQFGRTHALMVVDTFYENVTGPDGANQVLQFTPRDREPLLVACLWSRWVDPKGQAPDLLSFAAITDEPEPEVAAAGHDRTVINIKPEFVDAWLRPRSNLLSEMYAIFDDKQHPYYEHRIAA